MTLCRLRADKSSARDMACGIGARDTACRTHSKSAAARAGGVSGTESIRPHATRNAALVQFWGGLRTGPAEAWMTGLDA
jgi:hypothetical protein